MVGIFGDDDRRDEALGRNAAFDQTLGGGATSPSQARQAYLGRRVTMTLKRAGIMSSRSDASSPMLDPQAPAAWAVLVGEVDDHVLARQVLGQRAAIDPPLAGSGGAAASAVSRFPPPPRRRQSIVRRSSIRASWSGSIFSERGPKRWRRSSLMMAIRRSFSTPAAMTSALSAPASSGSELGVIVMRRANYA